MELLRQGAVELLDVAGAMQAPANRQVDCVIYTIEQALAGTQKAERQVPGVLEKKQHHLS